VKDLNQRITIEDANLVRQCGDQIFLGNAFAFIGPRAFDNPAVRWIKNMLGAEVKPEPRVLSLLGPEPAALPGASVAPLPLPSMSLAVVTSDKALYREGKDTVNLLVVDPLSPEATVTLELFMDGASFTRRRLGLDKNGVATAMLGDLPAGGYEVRVSTAAADDPPCSFTVAEYRLAPLTATMAERSLAGSELSFTLTLEAFAVPLSGEVDLELTERGQRLHRWRATAVDGLLRSRCDLDRGEGPHAINVQLVDDPSRTATVPIVGSRKAERSMTSFCTLGYEVDGSLLPADESREVRGIHLVEGAMRTSPITVDRVDTRRLKVEARADVRAACAVVLDPTAPTAGPGAVDPATAPHPSKDDGRYREGEAMFKEGRFEESMAAFGAGRAALDNPHPFYAYYEACCLAKLGRPGAAVAALGQAVRHGWSDFSHLAADDDLSAVHGEPGFKALLGRGRREVSLGAMNAGDTVEIDVPAPASVVALGAYVGDAPWEGWTATLAPAGPPPRVEVDEVCEPGRAATLKINCEQADATLHVIVKDTRLQTGDTPQSRLAGQIKSHVQQADERLEVGKPDQALTDYTALRFLTTGSEFPPSDIPMPPPPGAPPMPGAMYDEDEHMAYACEEEMSDLEAPVMPSPARAMAPGFAQAAPSMPRPEAPPPSGGGPYREPAPMPEPVQVKDEPEVLFAGLVPLLDGRGELSLDLPDAFTDYLVEAFSLGSGLDWGRTEARFSAEKQPFASLDLPAFVHPRDTAEGRLQIGSSGTPLTVSVARDGQPLELTMDGQPLPAFQTIDSSRATICFDAAAGDYEAHVNEQGGAGKDRATGRVDEPGKLRRKAVALQILRPGQRLLFGDVDGAVALRVLPGLERPFDALVDATGDYSHACCEQTAAKILAALAMLMMTRDAARRARAVAIILAGIKRERRMWLRGRGFKMYPDSSSSPDSYWGKKAALYLQQLALAPRDGELGGAVAQALQMAADTCRAYRLQWPPTNPQTCEEAYATARFGKGDAMSAAMKLVNARLGNGQELPANPELGGVVGMRAEGAYAAACMLRAGKAELSRALTLTNQVVRALGPNGRLYSTVDSTAAIALMTELRFAGIVNEAGGAGKVKVNGRELPLLEATRLVEAVEEVEAGAGVVAVEVTRITEESWEEYAAGVSLRVALERDGTPRRTFRPGDALDLHVTIEEGYKAGDLLWVCLPDCLSRVLGGGQVKRFSVDFEEQSELRVPLAATAPTSRGRQHFAVCLRNMFEEERAGNPGLLDVAVKN